MSTTNLFSNKGVEEAKGGGSNQKYIYGGVYHDVNIGKVSADTTPNGTPVLNVELYTTEGGKDAAKEFPFYFSAKAAQMSKEKLKHIATKVVKASEFEAIEASNLNEYAEAVNDLLKGGRLRLKFIAEEYENSNGEIKEAAKIGLAPFAEATQEGAEYAPVTDEDTELTFDKKNKYDFKALPKSASNEEEVGETANAAADVSDL